MSFRIEFLNLYSNSWLVAHIDFGCEGEYKTKEEAQEWIDDFNEDIDQEFRII